MYNFIDIDKNNFVDYKELTAALIVLCKSTMEAKLTYGIKIFSRSSDNKINWIEFKRLLNFIYKLSLENSSQILLDYDLNTLATQVADYAFDYCG